MSGFPLGKAAHAIWAVSAGTGDIGPGCRDMGGLLGGDGRMVGAPFCQRHDLRCRSREFAGSINFADEPSSCGEAWRESPEVKTRFARGRQKVPNGVHFRRWRLAPPSLPLRPVLG